jgi:hypothetical protein
MLQENLKKDKIQENKENNIDNIFVKTLQNTSSVLVLSIISKVFNILCNIILVRHISKEAYGISKIYLEFLFVLICSFPIDTIRKTSQKFCPDKDAEKETKKYYIVCQLYTLIYIPMIIYCIFLFFGFIIFDSTGTMKQIYIHLIVYIISGMLEILAEPVILHMNLHMENILIGKTLGNFVRIFTNVIFVVYFKLDLGSFTCSRFVGSFFYLIYFIYLGVFKYKINFWKFIPKNIKFFFDKKNNIIDGIDITPLKNIFYQFVGLTLLNMILSNCEKLILSFMLKQSNEEKSEYSFIAENFSIITRLLLRPIEDTFYNLINKLKNYESKNKNDKDKDKENNKNNSNNNIDIILDVLKLFIKFFSLFGILLISYYYLCGNDLIELVYSKKWATPVTEKIGIAYAIYISIISINGVVECFSNATNDSNQMHLSYIFLTLNSIFLLIITILISNWDICGLILANAISMVLRINGNLYIIFCGKKTEKNNIKENNEEKKYNNSLLLEIKKFQKECFVSNYTIIITGICLFIGKFIKKIFENKRLIIKIGSIGFIGMINIFFIILFEFKNIKNSFKKLKSI